MNVRRDDKVCRLLMRLRRSAVLQRKGRGQNDIFTRYTARYDAYALHVLSALPFR